MTLATIHLFPFPYTLMTLRGYPRIGNSLLSLTYLCHKHLTLSLKQWTDKKRTEMVFEIHRLHPAFQECNVSANLFFSLHRHILKGKKGCLVGLTK